MMKKILFISCFLASVATYSCYVTEQTTPSDSRPKSILEQAKKSYGSYRLDSLLASPILSDERKAAFQEADLDNDGLITQEEYEKLPNLASQWAAEARVKQEQKNIEKEMEARLIALFFEFQNRPAAVN